MEMAVITKPKKIYLNYQPKASSKKLNKTVNKPRIGMYGGKFVPFHLGHLTLIVNKHKNYDELHVVMGWNEERDQTLFTGDMPYIPPKLRKQWMLTELSKYPNVYVHDFEEIWKKETGELYSNEEIWEQGSNAIKELVGKPITHVLSSESSYEKYFKMCYGEEVEHVVVDEPRKLVNVSATRIRENGAMVEWDYLVPASKPFFAKKVAVVGVESTGKSTMVKQLSEHYNTTYVKEHGRTVSEEIGNGSDLLGREHYYEIVYGHKYHEYEQLKHVNKIMFIDSEAVVSQYYAEMYLGEHLELIDAVIATQDYDMYLYLEPDVKWVADGYRTFSDSTVRQQTNMKLKEMFDGYGIKCTFIDGGGDYNLRYQNAVQEVNKLIYN